MSMEIPPNIGAYRNPDQTITESLKDNDMGKGHISQEFVEKEESGELSPVEIREFLSGLENSLKQFNKRFELDVNENLGRVIVKVIDRDTDTVIREIPSREMQHLIVRLREALGLLFDMEI